MAEIIQLDASVYNKISAGEVIEKPSSVVKELVENSLDAGATEIAIEVHGGGLESIVVWDNGKGIAPDDLPRVFLPHATSKIHVADDLFCVRTMGFRGEAMASIAAVSMVTIRSRQAQADGYEIQANGQEISTPSVCSCACGTEVTVRNLFYHTPVRLRFCKPAKQEGRDISTLVQRLALAHPEVRISYKLEGKDVLQTTGSGLEEVVQMVFGEEAYSHFVPVKGEEYGYGVHGFVSDTIYSVGTRSAQIVILNGRVVSNANLNASINNVYRDYLMKRNYALYVLHITMPVEEVDVNVHPTKADVRFQYANKLYGFLYRTVRQAVESSMQERNLFFDVATREMPQASFATQQEQDEVVHLSRDNLPRHTNNTNPEPSFDGQSGFAEGNTFAERYMREMVAMPSIRATTNENRAYAQKEVDWSLLTSRNDAKPVQESIVEHPQLRIVGQVLGTYIVAEYGQDMLLIDQHAAAERVLYDRLMEQYTSHELVVQPMLLPYEFTLNEQEAAIIQSKLEAVNRLGIELTSTDELSFVLSSVPALLVDMDVQDFIHLLLSDFDRDAGQLFQEKLAYAACRAAIKGNTYLDNDSLQLLIDSLFDGAIPSQCPHGRPAYVRLSKTDLEKMFRRIV